MEPDRASGLPLGVRDCQLVRISGARQWFERMKGWVVMKPGMTWKTVAAAQAELTGRLAVPGADRGRPRGRAEGCVALDKCLPLSEPPFTHWRHWHLSARLWAGSTQVYLQGLDQGLVHSRCSVHGDLDHGGQGQEVLALHVDGEGCQVGQGVCRALLAAPY